MSTRQAKRGIVNAMGGADGCVTLAGMRDLWGLSATAAVTLSVALAVPGDSAVAEPIPITVEQGRAVIVMKVRAIDARRRDITSHAVSNCHRNVSRQIVLCQVRFTHADGEVCSGHGEVSKTRSGGRTSYVYRGYGFRCWR